MAEGTLILSAGEILFDVFPEYKRPGGAPFNFFYHIFRLGLDAVFLSRIGADESGAEMLDFLSKRQVSTEYIQKDPARPTGWVQVELDSNGIPDFTIIQNVAYDYLQYDSAIDALLPEIGLIYFGTLIQRAGGAATIRKILERKPASARSLYDMNLRPGCFSPGIIHQSLQACDILKVNEDELAFVMEMHSLSGPDDLGVDFLMHHFGIQWVCVTRGEKVSSLFTPDGRWDAPADEGRQPMDTVGAGDAYASIVAVGYLLNWQPETVVRRASELAGAICRISGAIPENSAFYNPYLKWIAEEPDGK
jgi:fructokinase